MSVIGVFAHAHVGNRFSRWQPRLQLGDAALDRLARGPSSCTRSIFGVRNAEEQKPIYACEHGSFRLTHRFIDRQTSDSGHRRHRFTPVYSVNDEHRVYEFGTVELRFSVRSTRLDARPQWSKSSEIGEGG